MQNTSEDEEDLRINKGAKATKVAKMNQNDGIF
jgi:hypothetical protein